MILLLFYSLCSEGFLNHRALSKRHQRCNINHNYFDVKTALNTGVPQRMLK